MLTYGSLFACKLGGAVIDPFSGSGTTGMVTVESLRKYVGIELSAEYLDLPAHAIRATIARTGGCAVTHGETHPERPTCSDGDRPIIELSRPTLVELVTLTRTGVGIETPAGDEVWLSAQDVHRLAAMDHPAVERNGVTLHLHADDVSLWAQIMPKLGGVTC